MKFKRYPKEISPFVALSTDGQEFKLNEADADYGKDYILDTNVIWFLQNPSDEEDGQLDGSDVKYFGRRFVAGNIRKCLEDMLDEDTGFLVTRSHNFELEVAVRSELQVDYECVKDSLKGVFSEVANKYRGRRNSKAEMAAEIVDMLKEHFREDFKAVSDILIGKPSRTSDLRAAISEISPENLAGDRFSRLSNFLNIILSVGGKRSSFSVRNDVKAIRDIISENISRGRRGHQPKLVFLTLDQRLLEACRVAKWLNLPLAEHLIVENCQSFWLWRRDPKHSKNSKSLSKVTNDFLTKSRKILRELDTNFSGKFSFASQTIFEPEMFTAAMNHLEVHGTSDESDSLLMLLARMMDQFTEVPFSKDSNADTDLLEALDGFFLEVNELLPSVQLSISSAEGYEAVLKERLNSCGVEQDVFLTALEDDIEEHARKSMEILGASSLITPKQPLAAFSEYQKFISASPQFHRMPIPIQSNVEIVEKISTLVNNEKISETTRYTELVKINDLRGLRADLVSAILAVASGNWKMAEAICVDATFYSGVDHLDTIHVAEIHILACSIFRIYRTNLERLTKAQDRLNKARSLLTESIDEKRTARIDSEEISIRVNRFLFLKYLRSTEGNEGGENTEPASDLINDLIEHAKGIIQCSLSEDLKTKLIANAGVNIVTVVFCSGPDRPKLTKQQLGIIAICLDASWIRISTVSTRVSFYEEIVTLYSIRDFGDFDLNNKVDVGILENKRKKKDAYREIALTTSQFEQWVLNHFV